MPTLADLLSRVSFLAAMPAVVGLFLTAEVLVVSREWRLNITALTIQYFFVVLLLTRQIRMEVAAVKGLIGWMICMVFYVTERRVASVQHDQAKRANTPSLSDRRWTMSARGSFSLLAGILVGVVAYTAALRIPLPEVAPDISLACYILVSFGILLIGLSETPMKVGLGTLMVISGFDLFYVALEPSLAVAGLLGAVSFIVALVTSYLRAVEITVPGQRGSG
jgi:hypothetical protein